MIAAYVATATDIGNFVRVGELPIGAVCSPAPDIELTVVDQYTDGTMGHFGENQRMVLVPSRLVRLLSLPLYHLAAARRAGCSVHDSAHDDTDERDCGSPAPCPEAEALKKLVLQYGLHSIEFGATGTNWGSASSRVRAGLGDEIDDAIDAVFAERDEWKKRAELALRSTARLRDAQPENAALVFRCADVAQEEAHKWELASLRASEEDYDASENEKWACSHAQVARAIEEKIRSFAPEAEAAITAAIADEEKT